MANTKQIYELKQVLLNRKSSILKNIQESTNSIDSLKSSQCNDEYDYAEVSSDSFKESIIIEQQGDELKEIEDALKRMEEGTYGICWMCDEPISISRLRAKPFAKYCTSCREIYEQESKIKD